MWQKGGRRGPAGDGEAHRGEITRPRSHCRVAVLTTLSGEQDWEVDAAAERNQETPDHVTCGPVDWNTCRV